MATGPDAGSGPPADPAADPLPDPVVGEDRCWELLAAQELGRLAYRIGTEQHLTPINYAVDVNRHGRRSLLFRTAATTTKLLAAELGDEVAFEIDEVTGEEATSVVVRGYLRHLQGDEAHRAENLPLRPWLGDGRYDVVELVPGEVTGRRFHLRRPWLHLRPEDPHH